jgi:hypothetical protein
VINDWANKWICHACSFVGPIEEFYFVVDPRRGDAADGWYACNQCDAIDQVTTCCDEPGCMREGSCGFPVDDDRRYRRTCFEHSTFNRRATVTITAATKPTNGETTNAPRDHGHQDEDPAS